MRRFMRRFGTVEALIALIATSTLLRLAAGRMVPSPWFSPDETIYAELGRSLYRTGGFEILGEPAAFFGLVYPALVGLPLSLSDVEAGYVLLKDLQALVMSLVAVPVYLWGRTLADERWALGAAALSLAVPGLALTGFVMTEVVFYPVCVLAAWTMARALTRPSLASQVALVGALGLAALTRLQALILVPAFLLAVVLYTAFTRSGIRSVFRLAPTFGALALVAVAWIAVTSLEGGSALGAYDVTTEGSYDPGLAARFVLSHVADLALVTAIMPLIATLLLAVSVVARAERSVEVSAFVAVTLAASVTFVTVSGVFASRFAGHVLERNLLPLAPLFFLGLVTWLDRGAPRLRAAAVLVPVATVLLVVVVRWNEVVVAAALPDAFTLIPLYELGTRGVPVALALGTVAGLLLAILLLVRRLPWLLPVSTLVVLAAAAVVASNVAADSASRYATGMVGTHKRWIDEVATGPVTFLYGSELRWSAGGPVWANTFWNRRVERAYTLFGTPIAGLPGTGAARVGADGVVSELDAAEVGARLAVASDPLALAGTPVAHSTAGFTLWRIEPPLRLTTRVEGKSAAGVLASRVRLTAYACKRGSLALTLTSPDERAITLTRDGSVFRIVTLSAAQPWSGDVPASPPRARRGEACTFGLTGTRGVQASRFAFVPSA